MSAGTREPQERVLVLSREHQIEMGRQELSACMQAFRDDAVADLLADGCEPGSILAEMDSDHVSGQVRVRVQGWRLSPAHEGPVVIETDTWVHELDDEGDDEPVPERRVRWWQRGVPIWALLVGVPLGHLLGLGIRHLLGL